MLLTLICHRFVCALRKSNASLARLRSYTVDSIGDGDFTIWQAARATSAATSFFDPISIGKGYQAREFVDGALGSNNPVDEVWNEAKEIWDGEGGGFEARLHCIVSIGTGNPGTVSVGDNPVTIFNTLKAIATETEKTEQRFARDHNQLIGEHRYFRFNVDHGLENVGLEEHKRQGDIINATLAYLNDQQLVKNRFRDCALSLNDRGSLRADLPGPAVGENSAISM